jgi:hypothetical protein
VLFVSGFFHHKAFTRLQPDIVFGMTLSLVITGKVTIKNKPSAIHPLLSIISPIFREIYSRLGTCDAEQS